MRFTSTRSNAQLKPSSALTNTPYCNPVASNEFVGVANTIGLPSQHWRETVAQGQGNSHKNHRSFRHRSLSNAGSSAKQRSPSVRCSSSSDSSDKQTPPGTMSDGGAAFFESLLETSRKPPLGLEVEELKLDAEKNKDEGFGDEETREDAAVLGLKHGWNKDGGEGNGASEAELQGAEDGGRKNGSGGAAPGGSHSLAAGQKEGEVGGGANGGQSAKLGATVGSGGGSGSSGSVPPPDDVFYVVESSKDAGVDYLGESTKFDMNMRDIRTPWLRKFDDVDLSSEKEAAAEAEKAENMLRNLGLPTHFPQGQASRGIFCSRTVNLRSITTIGYDMDYTLIHYNVRQWEGRAYEYGMDNLRRLGYPVEGLEFDPDLVIRGLIMDKERGNLVKADRFGYVKRAMHGTRMLSNRAISDVYGRELVDLRKEGRWEFLNTLFSVSEAVMYMQMVDRLDEGLLPPDVGRTDYQGLYQVVAKALFRAHVEGQLKAEIINDPERYVELDPDLPTTLLDQKQAGKRLLLITNSDYQYTSKMMSHSFDRFLPKGMVWRDLFDMVIISARKPDFFQKNHPLYEVVTEDGLMRPCFKAVSGGLYCGGSAHMVEKALGFSGDETMYVGDHIYTDVSVSKVHLRWRTALVCRELEREVDALACGRAHRERLVQLMNQKERVGDLFNQLRLALQRRGNGRDAQTHEATALSEKELTKQMTTLLLLMEQLDKKIVPMLEVDGEYFNKRWGYLSRAGLNDKSHLTRQIEKYADIYTSRVSNFLRYTPFMYFRSPNQSLAHDRSELWPESSLPHKPPPPEENAASWEAIAFSGEPGDLLIAADERQRVATGG
ncbi:haloacid dehalogenase-like hydrolase superfamily hydrolase subfamily IG 5'-nucleotidase [Klebsormidium nitens]|uniref:Haloacid dehalogenase-like hydrolase superfamily hydrolase subfamily IG 5'-nucleotidase n=1 Tax=Klebsormidium nitens TaxID=105231 RepID=A0A0U9HJ08_KLENI|nr:haloacid dehalogenase-like hydrolase superfamily hydrolase subfamily IG 5'-nucleotidase [Klebsormidium nitens]|eukprot:GAQ79423.1 haloacid dehalogenase-like hydrolase superfamily hydrolase subfamily IG 5'-nucleotidase [Klebsormidium nitens]